MSYKKKQLEIVKKIVEQGNCRGINCQGNCAKYKNYNCPLFDNGCAGAHKALYMAKDYLEAWQKNQNKEKISKKDLLKRVEKLEEKVDKIKKQDINAATREIYRGILLNRGECQQNDDSKCNDCKLNDVCLGPVDKFLLKTLDLYDFMLNKR